MADEASKQAVLADERVPNGEVAGASGDAPDAVATKAPETIEAAVTDVAVSSADAALEAAPAGELAGVMEVADEKIASTGGLSEAELAKLRANEVAFSWEAAEYVQHHKGAGWYAGLMGGMVVLAGATWLLKDWAATALFVVMGLAVVVYAHKAPRTLLYELTPTGITIDGKQFPFKKFRSFGVLPEAEWHTIDLDPIQRFSPRMTIMFEDDDFEDIVGHLELHLPRIDRKPDIIERASRYLRF